MNPATGPTLRDIHLPPPPDWWPPAPGWWLVGALVVACCIIGFYKLRKSIKRRRSNKAIMRELDRCVEAAHGEPAALAANLSQFLRRMALRESPPAAAFADERWLAYLDSRLEGAEFVRGIGRVLLDAPFRPAHVYDAPALVALVRRWTRRTLEQGRAHA